jgi:DNA-binding transcriptional MerR regulator
MGSEDDGDRRRKIHAGDDVSKLLKIGEIARLTGKSVRTIRYYEELGLLHSADHTKGGFRLFSQDDALRILLIDKFHQLGFSLEEVAEIITAYRTSASGDEANKKLRPALEKSLQAINDKISLLGGFRKEVQGSLAFVEDCAGCQQQPEQEGCSACKRGRHQAGAVPFFINTLLQ